MDIKGKRIRNDRNISDSYPGLPDGLGSQACDANINWYARSSSFQGNTNVDYKAIQAENEEQAQRWGVPYEDNLPNPNGVPANVGFSGVASRDVDQPLGNPHNFSSNPGYMGTSTASMLSAAAPGNGTTGTIRRAGAPGSTGMQPSRTVKSRRVGQPAPGDTDPVSEGSPQMMTSGYSG